ncbi:hypothetical protein ACRCRN_34105 [Pseudomonas aeruginosa]
MPSDTNNAELSLDLDQDRGQENNPPAVGEGNTEFVAVAGGDAQSSGGNTEQGQGAATTVAEQEKAKKQPESVAVLQSGKAAVKLYESLIGFDKNAEAQRVAIRVLLHKQSKAMENKMLGIKPEVGEDFDSISKLLRRENNRLDSMLDGKDSLVTSTSGAIDKAIEALNQMKTRIIKMEEEG